MLVRLSARCRCCGSALVNLSLVELLQAAEFLRDLRLQRRQLAVRLGRSQICGRRFLLRRRTTCDERVDRILVLRLRGPLRACVRAFAFVRVCKCVRAFSA